MPFHPRIAITVGDPAGIGPEIAARAAADPRVLAVCEPVLYAPDGDPPAHQADVVVRTFAELQSLAGVP